MARKNHKRGKRQQNSKRFRLHSNERRTTYRVPKHMRRAA